MTIFKEILEEEYLTVSEVKAELQTIEEERALDGEREMPYELARAIEHANRFSIMPPESAQEFVDELVELEKVDEATAYKIANLVPQDRDELRALYAQERYALDGDELDEILNVVAKYA